MASRCYWALVAFYNRGGQAVRIISTILAVCAPFVVAGWLFEAFVPGEYVA